MPVDLSLPETAKALSAPVTKLIEVCAAGCGKLFEPSGIRRKARADGDALVIMEEARARANEVSVRAARRLLDIEERRQVNIEAIAGEAAKLLPGQVTEDPVSTDWAARFFAECQDVSDEQMRTAWAKVLAGEVTQPGSFSARTLFVLKNISKAEADLFNTLSSHSLRGWGARSVFPFVNVGGDIDYWDRLGLTFAAFEHLQDAGLVSHHWVGHLTVNLNAPGMTLRSPGHHWTVNPRHVTDAAHVLSVGKVELTTAGKELAAICDWNLPEERSTFVTKWLASQGCIVQEVEVETIPSGRGVIFRPIREPIC